MEEFSVNTAELESLSSEMKTISSNLDMIAGSTAGTIKKLRKAISDKLGLIIKDNGAVEKIRKCSLYTDKMSLALLDIAGIYERTENNISEKKFHSNLPNLTGYDLADEFLDSRNQTKDAIIFGTTRGITEGLTALISQLFEIDDFTDDFNEKMIKEQILTVIDCNDIDLEFEEGVIDQLKKYLTDPAKYYNDIVELLEKSGEKYKYLKNCDQEFFEKLGKTLNYSSKGIELLDIIISDYSETLAKLEVMRTSLQSVNGDPEIINYIKELEEEYENKGIMIIDNVLDLVVNKGLDETIKIISNYATGGLLGIATGGYDLMMGVTGLSGKGDALASVYISNRYSDDLVASYEQQKAKIQSGNYTQEEYENCKTSFELARNAKIKEYENIRKHSKKETQKYIDQEIKKLESLKFEL